MRASLFVVEPPAFDGLPCIVQRQKPVFVQVLLTELAVERFGVAALNRTAGVMKCSVN